METNPFLDLMPIIDLSRTSGENLLVGDKLVNSVYYKVIKSVTETSSKIRKPKTHDEAINDSIYGNR